MNPPITVGMSGKAILIFCANSVVNSNVGEVEVKSIMSYLNSDTIDITLSMDMFSDSASIILTV
jgi:hypothetical protein